MTNAKFIMSILLFQFFFSAILASMTGTLFNLVSPLTFSVISGLLVTVIAASNTPIVKGVAMGVFFGAMAVFFTFSAVPLAIFGLVIAPLLIGMGLAMAEIGQG